MLWVHRVMATFVTVVIAASSSFAAAVEVKVPSDSESASPAMGLQTASVGPARERSGTSLETRAHVVGEAGASALAAFSDLQTLQLDGFNVTPTRLANTIMAGRGTVSNATFTGANNAGGVFFGGASTFQIHDGIALSSGSIQSVQGPNLVP